MYHEISVAEISITDFVPRIATALMSWNCHGLYAAKICCRAQSLALLVLLRHQSALAFCSQHSHVAALASSPLCWESARSARFLERPLEPAPLFTCPCSFNFEILAPKRCNSKMHSTMHVHETQISQNARGRICCISKVNHTAFLVQRFGAARMEIWASLFF